LGGLINSNIEILTCGVDTSFFDPLRSRPIDFKSKVIIFPSNPQREEKNFPLFMNVIEKLQLDNIITVKWIDKMSREEIRDLLSSADCLLMTSISEGSPQVVKEALSCGLPVVSVPVGNVAEMIEGVPNCFVSSSFNIDELYLLVSKSLIGKKYGIRNVFIGKRIYDNKEIAARLGEFYQIPKKVQ
jgi:glycosyltransferase involved in cell wall biosynthesis